MVIINSRYLSLLFHGAIDSTGLSLRDQSVSEQTDSLMFKTLYLAENYRIFSTVEKERKAGVNLGCVPNTQQHWHVVRLQDKCFQMTTVDKHVNQLFVNY